jgi:hypothetical protein
VYNEGEGERKDKGKRCEGETESKQVEELNDEGCKRYLDGKGNRPALYSSQMDSLRTVLSIHGGFYIHLYYLYICGFVNKLTNR